MQGAPPFPTGLPESELRRLVLEEDVHHVSSGSSVLDVAVQALHKDPGHRFATIAEFKNALTAARSRGIVQSGWGAKSLGLSRASRSWVWVGLAAALAWALWSHSREGQLTAELDQVAEQAEAFERALAAGITEAGDSASVALVLQRATAEAADAFADSPMQMSGAMLSVGRLQIDGGYPEEAVETLEQALTALWPTGVGPDSPNAELDPPAATLAAHLNFELARARLAASAPRLAAEHARTALTLQPYSAVTSARASALTLLAQAIRLEDDNLAEADSLLGEASALSVDRHGAGALPRERQDMVRTGAREGSHG